MKLSQMKPSKYLKQGDVGKPTPVTIASFATETVGQGQDAEECVVLYFQNCSKGMVCNSTNLGILVELFGDVDSQQLIGQQVTLWSDPNVSYAGKRTGGLRIMDPRTLNAFKGATPMTPATGYQVPGQAPQQAPALPQSENAHLPGDTSPTAGVAPVEPGFLQETPPLNTADSVFSQDSDDPFKDGAV